MVGEFDCRETLVLVFKARFNIKSNPNCKKVWINERLDDEQRLQRMELRALADLAKDKKREARVVGDTLIVSGIKYKHTDIDKLPDEVNLEDAFTRVDGEHIYFNSEHSFLSAFYPQSSRTKVKYTRWRNRLTRIERLRRKMVIMI